MNTVTNNNNSKITSHAILHIVGRQSSKAMVKHGKYSC